MVKTPLYGGSITRMCRLLDIFVIHGSFASEENRCEISLEDKPMKL